MENGIKYFPRPLKKLYKTFTMETYILSFSHPYLSPSIKSEHECLVSQGSNIYLCTGNTQQPHITRI